MTSYNLPFNEINILSPLISDYINRVAQVKAFTHDTPNTDLLIKLAESRQNFSSAHRETLVNVLKEQYRKLPSSEAVTRNINLLREEQTFTITTGHQLNLATGPIYFVYKILNAINMAEEMNKADKSRQYVPVFWMATEDHDFEEINHCKLFNETYQWKTKAGNATGRLKLQADIDEVMEQFNKKLGDFDEGNVLIDLLHQAYKESENLADATQKLTHALFGKYGLVVLNPDDRRLKKLFAPIMLDELMNRPTQAIVQRTSDTLNDGGYKIQAHVRDINLFLLDDNLRKRISKQGSDYELIGDSDILNGQELLNQLERSPEKFSPNVILRPVYQESILPNICYIGGGGELAYWMQLKPLFSHFKVPYPALQLRNMVLLTEPHHQEKLEKLRLDVFDLNQDFHVLSNHWIKMHAEHEISLQEEKKQLQQIYQQIADKAAQIDQTMVPAVEGSEKGQLKALDGLEKKLVKAEKRQHDISLSQMQRLQDDLFPNGNLQERSVNVFEFLAKYRLAFIDELKKQLTAFPDSFQVIKL